MPNSTQKKVVADLHIVAESMDVFFLLTMGMIVFCKF